MPKRRRYTKQFKEAWRLGVRLPFDLYELDRQGKREFGAKSPTIPPPKRKCKRGPAPLTEHSQFYSQFTPSFGPGCESTAIVLYRRARARIACVDGQFVTFNRTQSSLVIFGSEETTDLAVGGSTPSGSQGLPKFDQALRWIGMTSTPAFSLSR